MEIFFIILQKKSSYFSSQNIIIIEFNNFDLMIKNKNLNSNHMRAIEWEREGNKEINNVQRRKIDDY